MNTAQAVDATFTVIEADTRHTRKTGGLLGTVVFDVLQRLHICRIPCIVSAECIADESRTGTAMHP